MCKYLKLCWSMHSVDHQICLQRYCTYCMFSVWSILVFCRESLNGIILLRKPNILQRTFAIFTHRVYNITKLYPSWPLTVHQPPTVRRGWGAGSCFPWSSLCGWRRRVPNHGGTDLDCCSHWINCYFWQNNKLKH